MEGEELLEFFGTVEQVCKDIPGVDVPCETGFGDSGVGMMMEASHAHATQMLHGRCVRPHQIPPVLDPFVFQYMGSMSKNLVRQTMEPCFHGFVSSLLHVAEHRCSRCEVRAIQRDAFQHGLNIGCFRGYPLVI